MTNFLKDESGATAIEYALLAAMVGLTIIPFMTSFGSAFRTNYGNINDNLK